MSDNNRGDRGAFIAKWGGGALTVVVCLMVTWLIGAQYGENRGYQKANTEHSASPNSNEIENACAGFSGFELTRCSYEVQKKTEEARRTEHDLQAQREVSLWTFWLLIATGAGIGLTGIGLYYLAANLSEMQRQRIVSANAVAVANEANTISREIGQAQTRAYLGCIDAEYRVFSEWVEVWVRVKNYGNSPASNIKLSGNIQTTNFKKLLSSTSITPATLRGNNISGHLPRLAAGEEGRGLLFWPLVAYPSQDLDRAIEELISEFTDPNVSCTISWDDVFGQWPGNNVVVFLDVESRNVPQRESGQLGDGYMLKPYNK